MEVSVALGVLVSELSVEPWKGKMITFSENPKLQIVEGEDLRSKVKFVRDMEWGMNTGFQKVFDLILKVAVNGNFKEDEMIKKVFVFSDMEFDQASANPWKTDYQTIVRKFEKKGYRNCVPEIVFWNLRDSRATPVAANQKGVALVSGFSKNLLTLFLKEGDFNPEDIMEAAISGEEYQKLVHRCFVKFGNDKASYTNSWPHLVAIIGTRDYGRAVHSALSRPILINVIRLGNNRLISLVDASCKPTKTPNKALFDKANVPTTSDKINPFELADLTKSTGRAGCEGVISEEKESLRDRFYSTI
ncbi:hypothetical protein RND71_040682 [Anisodus tanguticus]|uniref:DUF7788 domain-containing protein n=1 Tax=Anisodus tanguticus TaxID=243964 RepID=A0AAE1UVY4_9SOLA|nr:hypothetical protein RND71_040682 [Anisodus tanguticus]